MRKEFLKRFFCVLLCLCMMLQNAPLMAWATEAPEESTEATKAPTEVTEEPTEATEEPTEATEPSTEATEEATEVTEVPTEATEAPTEATEVPTEATEAPTEATEPPVEATEPVITPVESETEHVTRKVTPGVDLPDSDELFAEYAWQELYGSGAATIGTAARANLNEAEQSVYDALKARIETVAASGGSTVFELSGISGLKTQWTNTELGVGSIEDPTVIQGLFEAQFEMGSIIDALLCDCPFDLYWYDKTCYGGVAMDYSLGRRGQTVNGVTTWTTAEISGLTFTFAVASGYRGGNAITVTSGVSAVGTAKAKAQAIVSAHAAKTAQEKLTAYKDEICALVSYNHSAADDASTPYGDPWQLIYVFDGNSATNVVCEGYAKAFQYLCDLGGLRSISVSGEMSGGTGAGAHMWNIVTLDGGNYLADLTNCDTGSVGEAGGLFLVGNGSGSVSAGYSFAVSGQTIRYAYDTDSRSTWTTAQLTLAKSDYTPACTHTYDNDDDATCNTCGAVRDVSVPPVPATPYKIVNVVSGIHVYWKAVDGAGKYGLWRSESGANGTYKWIANPKVPHFTDTAVESGKTYYYKVTAMNTANGRHSAMSGSVGMVYVSTPDITSRANTAGGVALGWEKITGATGYAIYRKSYSGSDAWVRIATISGNSTFTWTDSSVKNNNGEIFKYTIRALAGSKMNILSGCRGAGRTMVRLSSQVLTSATKASATSILCKWTTSSRVTGYEVRFVVDGTVYKTFTVGNYKTGAKTFTGLKAGQTYTIQVRTYKKVDGVGAFYSDWSTAKTVKL